jgi:transcriptional regulator with XRE-family HTH domain
MRRRRTNDELDGDRESGRIALVLGAGLRGSRRRAGLTQEQVGDRVGVKRARIGEIERGKGSSAPLALWVRLGKAVDRPFAASFPRDLREVPEPADAGHLAAQELVLQLARRTGRVGEFELPSSCWLLVDNAANRAIVRRFPEIVRVGSRARRLTGCARWSRGPSHRATPASRGSIRAQETSPSSACAVDCLPPPCRDRCCFHQHSPAWDELRNAFGACYPPTH